MKDKKTFPAVFFLFIFSLTAFHNAAGAEKYPLPSAAGAGITCEDAYLKGQQDFNSLPSAQTHAGPSILSLDPGDNILYKYYLERYSSPLYINWLSSVMERADMYIDFIEQHIYEKKVPPELLFLPVVESAYRHNAVSRSGAVGLWQFMTNSIDPYDMAVDDWADERRDFWKATEGALEKLLYNYRILGNDWYLALAAYNCGLGRVQRTIAATGINNYWELSEKGLLPAETVHYVPKLLAFSKILMNSGRYGINLEWREPRRWERVRLENPVSLSIISEKTGIPHEILKTANAELRYDITPPGRVYYLKVPEGKGDLTADIVSKEKERLVNFHLYQIKHGDTLYDLGMHYGVTVSMIQSYNRNINPQALRVGAKILVPAVRQVPPYPGRPRAAASIASTDNPELYVNVHVVQPGETLWSISKRYGTTPDNLAFHNRMEINSILSIGMKLKVPSAEGVDS